MGWSWTDGSPWDYENWAAGSPSRSYQGEPEDCLENLALAHGEDEKGMWNDRGCTNIGHGNLGYVCKLNEGELDGYVRIDKLFFCFTLVQAGLGLMDNVTNL